MDVVFLLFTVSDLLIKFMLILLILFLLIQSFQSISVDKRRRAEIDRLKELNDDLSILYQTPIKKAREFFNKTSN